MESSQSSQSSQRDNTERLQSPDYGPIEPEPDTTFYFESDHLALKGNVDYLKILKHIALLEVHRKLVIKDLQFYYDLEKQVADSDIPSEIARKIASKEIQIPIKRKIPKRPAVDWTKYNIQAKDSTEEVSGQKASQSSKIPTTTTIPTQTKDVTKPESFNKPWSAEEQIRLEELLLKYPPEKSDSARFRKIAQELGNRTLTQVCSRVQKYYKKMRNIGQKSVLFHHKHKPRKYAKIIHKQNKMLVRETTFLPALSVQSDNKIFMDQSTSEEEGEEEADEGEGGGIGGESRSTMKQWVRILERIKRDKKNEEEMRSVIHHDLQCYVCKEQPIIGTRWHCLSCSCGDTSVNMCNDCTILQLQPPTNSEEAGMSNSEAGMSNSPVGTSNSQACPPSSQAGMSSQAGISSSQAGMSSQAGIRHPLHHLLHPYPVNNYQMVTSDGQPLDYNYLPTNAFASTSYLDPNMRTEY
ncbi:hypothetical protein M8J76_005785 [Diaphorina citri]|nr:hypothetical protein M8J76_005785 [Diaphorina citri]